MTPSTEAARPIEGVVLDVFGTIARIGEKRHPYRRLLEQARAQGRRPSDDDAKEIMSRNCGLAGIVDWLRLDLPLASLSEIELELYAELPTIRLYPETIPVLEGLRQRGIKVGLCSNLAAPYAVPIKALLPFPLDGYAWSFEVGAVKPDPAIYAAVCDALQLPPEAILFVGDTFEADVRGPRAFGMQAKFLVRDERATVTGAVSSLDQILRLIE